MMTIAIGDRLPDVALTLSDDSVVRLPDYAGKPLVLYFYPKDDTPGCTNEAKDFSALAGEFAAAGVTVLGVSKDTPAKHRKFIAKYDLNLLLGSDGDDNSVLSAFGAWVEKSMYGKSYMGIDRSTFLFAADGTLVREWRKVKVKGHADEVLAAARAL
ncbi:peroxiredoxin [Sphingomonas sp. BGYR3]|uniref:peroxiredoxin n=1 Tax=Sphingomonas sp. BGYR3 TaxID=2975483 RepID=UPI0021A785E1|nr:peroxiredoxin [Sphingomonas sp. BGYR3]MDG5488121.1 peroxiredoxin [Sphingomonas sp. BGYR3]